MGASFIIYRLLAVVACADPWALVRAPLIGHVPPWLETVGVVAFGLLAMKDGLLPEVGHLVILVAWHLVPLEASCLATYPTETNDEILLQEPFQSNLKHELHEHHTLMWYRSTYICRKIRWFRSCTPVQYLLSFFAHSLFLDSSWLLLVSPISESHSWLPCVVSMHSLADVKVKDHVNRPTEKTT